MGTLFASVGRGSETRQSFDGVGGLPDDSLGGFRHVGWGRGASRHGRRLRDVVRGALALLLGGVLSAGATGQAPASPDPRFAVGEVLASDDFAGGLGQWRTELESGGTVATRDGNLEIDVPGGCSVWFAQPLAGPLLITYEATAVSAGGANDRVSDLNCFWMADDARSPGDLFATRRSGTFADYDQLRCYYVGYGGNANTTSRFRRYIGERGNRPLRPEHDLTGAENLLVPNAAQRIQIVAAGGVIGFYHNGRRLFSYDDPAPYTRGWFAFRTVKSHLRIRDFRVYRLVPVPGPVDAP